jgi:hypothetical protein
VILVFQKKMNPGPWKKLSRRKAEIPKPVSAKDLAGQPGLQSASFSLGEASGGLCRHWLVSFCD